MSKSYLRNNDEENLDPKKMVMPGDLDRLERSVNQLSNQFDEFMERDDKRQESVMDIEEDLKLLLMLLQGNKLNKDDKGLVGLVIDQGKRIDKLEKFRDRVIYILIGASLATGYAISDLIALIKR